MSLFAELKRRNVIRVATAYVVSAWLIIQVVETTFPVFGFFDDSIRIVIIVLAIGFVPAVVGAWVLQITPEGLRFDKDAGDMQRSRKVDPEVLSLTVQAEQFWQTRPDGAGRKMYALLSRALEIDPDYIPALDAMVGAYWFLMDEGELSWDESMQKIEATYDHIL